MIVCTNDRSERKEVEISYALDRKDAAKDHGRAWLIPGNLDQIVKATGDVLHETADRVGGDLKGVTASLEQALKDKANEDKK